MTDQRPLYHFRPAENWMNDPNGLIQWQGEYHLFYQYNPFAPVHGSIHWGHAASRDLVHWRHLPIALAPQPGGPDADGCWSGCAVGDDGTPTLMYTGARRDEATLHETQCLATSDDGLLTWHKHPANPVIAGPPQGLPVRAFRDPCVWRDGRTWYCIVGTGIDGVGGAALLYRSGDLLDWAYLGPLCDASVRTADGRIGGEVWECPQFFALGDKHVLLVSCMVEGRARPRPIYLVGSFAGGRFTLERMETFDWGPDYYAPATMRDEQGRRLAWGWSWEARDEAAQRAAGWAGVMSLPRLLTLRPDGLLGIEPVPELAALRARRWSFSDVKVAPEATCILEGVQGDALEIIATFAPDVQVGGVVVRRSPDAEEHTEIRYDRATHGLILQRGEASADPQAQGGAYGGRSLAAPGPDEPLVVRVFVDHSIVEVYVNGCMALTARIYPTREDSLGVGIIAGGGCARAASVDVWTLTPHAAGTPA